MSAFPPDHIQAEYFNGVLKQKSDSNINIDAANK